MATEHPQAPARQGHVPAERPWDGGDTAALGEALRGQAWNPHLGSAGGTQPQPEQSWNGNSSTPRQRASGQLLGKVTGEF